jgi:two-component system LytT family response regulator
MKKYPFEQNKMLIINQKTKKKIPINDILYLKADNNYTYFIMVSGIIFLVSHSIKYYEDFLQNLHFVRVHRKYIINSLYVYDFILSSPELILSNGETIAISRRYKKVVNQILGQIPK